MPDLMLDSLLPALLGLLVGAALVALMGHKGRQSLTGKIRERDEALQQADFAVRQVKDQEKRVGEQADKLEAALQAANDKLVTAKAELAAQEARMAERERAVEQERLSLVSLRGALEEKFKILAHESLEASQKSFLLRAEETLKTYKVAADGDLSARHKAIETLLKPMQDSLKRYEDNLGAIEKARTEAYGSLNSELKNVLQAQDGVRSETAKLVNALRAQPKTRGRWGEHQLQRVMELAGMSEHVDFDTQSSFVDEDQKRLIPDAIIRLPGDRTIVVDAKTSLSAYFDAIEAVDELSRETFLAKHAREIRTHMKALGQKSYWQNLKDSPDFVAMFIPGENFYAAAIERDPDLFEDAIRSHVLIVTPTTLIALAKAVAYGWRQEAMAENARHVAQLGHDLYERLSVMGGHVANTGKHLERAVGSYNAMVGSLERSVMSQARKFEDLKVDHTGKDLPELTPVLTEARALAAHEFKEALADESAKKTTNAEATGENKLVHRS
ncbi:MULTISPECIES: DNA recombination protein RmuC [unclassified Iodidimonas]|jgi:DNA recombination protein RmuC|uniref:DNA recombination protein RmuC n=1 Tax=unclassified Iodidimonas TaxID=2626145 RepID=UPI002482A4BA|nr:MULTISPECIES: DNA recombination protein RmuC [unclassified Iodidimonas]